MIEKTERGKFNIIRMFSCVSYCRIITYLILSLSMMVAPAVMAEDDNASQTKMNRIQSIIDTRNKQVNTGDGEISAWRSPADQDFKSSGFKMLQGLGVCVGLFLVLAHFLKKYGAGRGGVVRNRMQIIEKCSLAPKTSLMMVLIDGVEYVVAVGSERVTLIKGSNRTEFVQSISLDQALQEICEKEKDLAA